jgi:hypothetical protein
MAKKLFSILVAAGLVGGALITAPVTAGAQEAPSEAKLFLRSTGCPASSDNSDYLSLEDADEEIQCFFTGSGIRNEIGEQTGTIGAQGQNAVSDRETATRYWDALDGVPVVLDATKPITGQIWTSGGACAVGGVPCSPAGLGAGEMIFDINFVGTQGGTEVEVATFTATYEVVPGTVQLIEIEAAIDPSLDGAQLDTFEMRTWQHGSSVGHGVVNTNGETSSYISVPTKSDDTDPPVKKGCKKGKGKKKGCNKAGNAGGREAR